VSIVTIYGISNQALEQLSHKLRLSATAKLLYQLPLYPSNVHKHPFIDMGLRLSNVQRGG
jgi:hypothetical protein